jgi:transposase
VGRWCSWATARGPDALEPFWKRLQPSGVKVKAVAMDISATHRSAVSLHLKEAVIVFDHFHFVKLFNDKLYDLQRSLYHRAEAD